MGLPAVGRASLKLLGVLYAYYLVWMIATPFIQPSHPLLDYFPPREYGLAAPALVVNAGVLVIYTYMCLLLMWDEKRGFTALEDR